MKCQPNQILESVARVQISNRSTVSLSISAQLIRKRMVMPSSPVAAWCVSSKCLKMPLTLQGKTEPTIKCQPSQGLESVARVADFQSVNGGLVNLRAACGKPDRDAEFLGRRAGQCHVS